jgi:hypothetical protein
MHRRRRRDVKSVIVSLAERQAHATGLPARWRTTSPAGMAMARDSGPHPGEERWGWAAAGHPRRRAARGGRAAVTRSREQLPTATSTSSSVVTGDGVRAPICHPGLHAVADPGRRPGAK